MKVLVTGAAGFIASHLIDALRQASHDVIGLDSLDPGVHHHPPAYLRPDVDYCFADLRHWTPDARFHNIEAVFHLAALGGVSRAAHEPANIITANAGGTIRLAEAATHWSNLSKFILISSFSIYGSNYRYRCATCGHEQSATRHPTDLAQGRYEVFCALCHHPCDVLPITVAAPPDPLETYGASKYMQELCLRGYRHCPVQILRLSSVYGTRLRLDDGEATIIAKLAGWIRSGQQPTLYEDGCQIRDWVYVDDVVATALAVWEQGAPPVVNVCSGQPTTLLEACSILSQTLGVECHPKVAGGYRAGDMRHCLGDPSVMRALIGRDPVPFRDGAKLAFKLCAAS